MEKDLSKHETIKAIALKIPKAMSRAIHLVDWTPDKTGDGEEVYWANGEGQEESHVEEEWYDFDVLTRSGRRGIRRV